MKTLYPLSLIIVLSFFVSSFAKTDHKNISYKKTSTVAPVYKNSGSDNVNEISNDFFKRYSDLKRYKSDVMSLYKNRTLGTIWFDEDAINEFGSALYQKAKKTNDLVVPYQKEIDALFSSSATKLSKTDADMLLSSLYIAYAKKSNADAGKKISYDAMLKDFLNYSTIEEATTSTTENVKVTYDQYYKLQE